MTCIKCGWSDCGTVCLRDDAGMAVRGLDAERKKWLDITAAWHRVDAAHRTRIAGLEAFVAEVRRHISGECDGITPGDCIEVIAYALKKLGPSQATSEETKR